ncbi:MAG: DJ-1/PfpI family protein [Gammaproteobacteria bacterium]|nr:MAG: DJ-1/PfpI family protein [Gammaproteobacteria bacterium]
MSRVLVPLAEGFEEIEAVTVVDLLRRAKVEVVTAGLKDGPVKASRGIVMIPDMTLEQAAQEEPFDMIVLPGGLPGADYLNADDRVIGLLERTDHNGGYIAAICAAPKVLAEHGLLDNKRAVSFPGVLESMQVEGMMLTDSPVVQDGRVITSKGPGTAMDFALQLIEVLEGTAVRQQVESGLQRP